MASGGEFAVEANVRRSLHDDTSLGLVKSTERHRSEQ